MRKYYCDVCFQEFTRRWNMRRHRQMMHGYQLSFTQPFQFDNYRPTSLYHPTQSNKTVDPVKSLQHEVSDLLWKVDVLRELREIKSILTAILVQGKQLN